MKCETCWRKNLKHKTLNSFAADCFKFNVLSSKLRIAVYSH